MPDNVTDKPKVSKAQQKAVQKYVKNNYDRIMLTLPKGRKAAIQAAAALHEESVNAYIKRAIYEALQHDGVTLEIEDSTDKTTE